MGRGPASPARVKRRAVGIALVEGATEASRQTGIGRTTIIGWRDSEEYDDLRQRTREAATEELWAIIQKGFRRLADLIPESDDLQKTAIATAIVVDKMLLLRGEATDRHESRDVTRDLDDHERELLGTAVRRELARRADEGSAGAAVGPPSATGAETTSG